MEEKCCNSSQGAGIRPGLPATDGHKDVPRICPQFARGAVPGMGWRLRGSVPDWAGGSPGLWQRGKSSSPCSWRGFGLRDGGKAVSGLVAEPGLTPCSAQRPTNVCIRGAAETKSPLHLPDFVLVTLYYPIGEQGPQTPTAWLTPATLPMTASAPADHHNARLPQAAPAFLRELPSAHKRVWTPPQPRASHMCPQHLCCTLPTGSHACHVFPLLIQAAPAQPPRGPPSPHTNPLVLLPGPQLCTHTHSPLDTSQAPGEGGEKEGLLEC